MLDNVTVQTVAVGNNSTVTYYPVLPDYVDGADIRCSKCAPGTGTVTVTAGVAVFSSAQASLIVGSKLRIGTLPGALDEIYEIAERTDSQNFKLKGLDTIGASQFFLIDGATELIQDIDFTLDSNGIQTVVAVPATSIFLIWRDTPLTSLLDIPPAGPLDQTAIMGAFDRATRQIQELGAKVNGTGLGAPPPGTPPSLLQDTTTFADAAARGTAVPSRIGQLGVQLDTNVIYRATGTTAGQWTVAKNSPPVLAANQAAVTAAIPTYIGEILIKLDDSSVWVAWGLSAGNWNLAWTTHPSIWDRMPWAQDETVLPGTIPRWCGHFSRRTVVESVTVAVAQAGQGDLVCRLILPSSARSLSLSTFVLTGAASVTKTSAALTDSIEGTLLNAVWTGGISPGEHLVCEILLAGVSQDFDTTAGTNVVTLNGGAPSAALPGAQVIVDSSFPNNGKVYVIENVRTGSGYGTITLSHSQPFTTTTTGTGGGDRVFCYGVTGLALTTGTSIIPCSAFEAGLAREGMLAYGDTVQPGTYVQAATPGGPSFTLSKPVNGPTSVVALVDPNQPPIQRHVVPTILSGATSGSIAHTFGIKIGDTLKGTNVAANTYLTSVATPPAVTIGWTPALTGNVTELWVFPPERTCTALAGANILPLSNVTGIKIGRKVLGPGIPEDTWIIGISAPDIETSRSLTKDITAETLIFTREVCQHSGGLSQGSPNITLAYPVTDTDIEIGQLVTGLNVPAGTFVIGVSGSTVTVNNNLNTSGVTTLYFHQNPSWKGLEVNINGHYISTTPPR